MAGFGEGDRRFHRLGVANFADHDHVGRFAHGVLQRVVEAVRVEADLALIDDRLFVLVQVFDRVLDGEDMARGAFVAVVDHGGQRGRLARAGRADDEQQPARLHDQVLEHERQLQFLDARHDGLDRADHQANLAALAEDVDAEAAHVLELGDEVHLQIALEAHDLVLVHHRIGDALGQAGRHRRGAERGQHAGNLDVDRSAGGQEQVRGVLVVHQFEKVRDIHALRSTRSLRCQSRRCHCARALWTMCVTAESPPHPAK